MSIFYRSRRIARRSCAVAAGLWSVVGCAAVRSRFASHEDVFPPIPLTIGEARVIGTDTAYTLSGRGYEIVAPTRDLLPDAQQALDDAARGFQRYLAAEPPHLVVDLRVRRDSISAPGVQPRGRARGDTVAVALPRAREDRRAPRGLTPRVGAVVTVPVVRAWLTSYAAASARPAAPSGASAAGAAEEPWGRDPRVPDWIEVALPPLVAGSPIADFAATELRRRKDGLIPLRTLFDSAHAERGAGVPGAAEEAPIGRAAPGSAPAGSRRRAEKLDQVMLFDVQSIAVARFLTERAGPTILGDVVRAAMRGGRIDDVLRSSAGVPQNVDALDATWRAWLQEQRTGRPGGR